MEGLQLSINDLLIPILSTRRRNRYRYRYRAQGRFGHAGSQKKQFYAELCQKVILAQQTENRFALKHEAINLKDKFVPSGSV